MSSLKRRKIIADDKIPYLSGSLEPFFEVEYLPAKSFTPERVAEAEALIVRTTVRCDEALLQGSRVRLIATATIGFDHIDTDYCLRNGIQWNNAPGCNARSVAQYIGASLALLHRQGRWDYRGRTLGIVGLGHVGRQVAQAALALGLHVLAYDPLLSSDEREQSTVRLTDLSTLCKEAEIISLHTPLTRNGQSPYPTFHLVDTRFFNSLHRSPVIVNSARGGIVSETALLTALEQGLVSGCLLDCWEDEPHPNPLLLERSWIHTPHIAGYSADGKWNGTRQTLETVSRFFNIPIVEPRKMEELDHKENSTTSPSSNLKRTIDLQSVAPHQQIDHALLTSYPNLLDESNTLLHSPEEFHAFRDHYRLRREPSAFQIRNAASENISTLRALGFVVIAGE